MKHNIERIQAWAQQVGIYEHSTVQAQTLKAFAEMGELADAVIKHDLTALEDGIGDVIVCLVNVAYMSGIDVVDAFAKVTDEVTARREHNPDHPYVRKMVGCGHGRLFSEPCKECEIVALKEEYRRAIRTVQRVRDRLRVLGAPLPGQTSGGHKV